MLFRSPGNADTLVYLGGNEQSSHKYISELLGKGTIDKRSSGETLGKRGSSSRNYDVLGRDMPYLFVKSSDALKIKINGQGHDHLVSSQISMIFTGGTYGKSECKKIDSLQRKYKRL